MCVFKRKRISVDGALVHRLGRLYNDVLSVSIYTWTYSATMYNSELKDKVIGLKQSLENVIQVLKTVSLFPGPF